MPPRLRSPQPTRAAAHARRVVLACGLALACVPGAARAQTGASTLQTQVTANGTWFFGRDFANNAPLAQAARTNANAAFVSFTARLTGYGVQDFEGVATPATVPFGSSLTVGFAGAPAITGQLQDTESNLGPDAGQVQVVTGPQLINLYSVGPLGGGDGTNFVRADDDVRLSFTNALPGDPLRAFGFWGVDVGDRNRDLTVRLTAGGATIAQQFVDDFAGTSSGGGSVFFAAFLANPGVTIAGVDFDRTQNTGFCSGVEAPCLLPDTFGYDHFVVASAAQVVPEPSTYALFGAGLAGLVAAARRRRRA